MFVCPVPYLIHIFPLSKKKLPVSDSFCRAIARELAEITAHPAPDPDDFLYTQWNRPFAPADPRSAHRILTEVDHEYHDDQLGMHSIRRTMLKSWSQVHETTKKRK
jgi:putative membrane protein